METSRTDLERLWSDIQTPKSGQMSGRLIRPTPRIWVAVDVARVPHLLIGADKSDVGTRIPATKGLRLGVEELRIGETAHDAFITIACSEETYRDTFAALCVELIRSISEGQEVAGVGAILRRWRAFFQERRPRLSESEQLGLFGELWFLEHWLGLPGGVAWWKGPLGAHHDFQSGHASIEVKATAVARGPVVHRISSVHQLDAPETGQLLLYSLRVLRDEVAANSLAGTVTRITKRLEGDVNASERFLATLARSGYNPGDEDHYKATWRILRQGLYEVRGDFPRINSRDAQAWKAGVTEVSYSIVLDACAPWLVAESPAQHLFGQSK